MTYPLPFVRSLMSLTQHTLVGSAVAGASAAVLLGLTGVQVRGLPKLASSVAGLGVAAVGYRQYLDNKKLTEIGQDLGIVERKAGISWYSSLLSHTPVASSVQIQSEPTAHTSPPMQDIVSYWQAQDKHLLVVGGTGAGKSYFIQAFASQLGVNWAYKIYDTDCTIDDWTYLRSLPSCVLYESFSAVELQMQEDLRVIESRTKERKQAGNKWQTEDTLIVAEEMPALVDECESAGTWMSRQAKRGRRVKRYVAVVAQNDTVKNLGMEGDSKLRDSCFVRVYLGQSAIERAQLLKDKQLEKALREGDKSVCLVDDRLAVRPSLRQFAPVPTLENAETLTESQSSHGSHGSQELENNPNIGKLDPLEPSELSNPSPLTGIQELSPFLVSHLRQLHNQGKSIQQILQQELGQKKGSSWGRKVAWLSELLNTEEDKGNED